MNSGKKNLLGDLVMSTVIGCATLFAFLFMCILIGTTLTVIVSFLKNAN